MKYLKCPDCGISSITEGYLEKYGRCKSCQQRQKDLINSGKEYVELKDVINKDSNYGKQTYRATSDFINFLKSKSNLPLRQIHTQVKKYYTQYSQKSELSLRYFMNKHNLQFASGLNQPRIKSKSKSQVKKSNSNTTVRKNTIYTDDVVQYIKDICNSSTELLTTSQIKDRVLEKFPDKHITTDNLYRCLQRFNLKFKITPRGSHFKKDDQFTTVLNDLVNSDNQEEDIQVKPVILQDKEKRLQPIYDEVDKVSKQKFKELNCDIDKNFDTNTYIKLLEMLLYLSTNYEKLIDNRKNQHDIMTAYQADVVHEQENVLSEPGDTYFQDKLYVLRQKRRFYQYDSSDLNSLKPFLQTINTERLEQSLTYLKSNKEKRDDVKFIPLVDTGMIEKYDWAVESTSAIESGKQISTYTSRQHKINRSTTNNRYLVSCKVSGGGYGVFTPWRREYMCATDDIAKNLAIKELRMLQSKNTGILYTGLSVVKLN